MDRSFFNSVFKLVGAAIIVQIVNIISVPVLARIFPPNVLGQFVLFNSIVGILGTIGTGKYEIAILLPVEKCDAVSLVFVSIGFTLIGTIMILIFVLLAGEHIAKIGEFRSIEKYFLLIPVSVFFICINRTLLYWCNREGKFGLNAKVNIANAVIAKGGSILCGFSGFIASFFLILVHLVVMFIEFIVRVKIFVSENGKYIFKNRQDLHIKQNLFRYRKFPLVDTLNGILDTSSVLIVPILLSIFFSSTDVGLYSQSVTIAQLPVVVIASAIGQVLFKRLSDAKSIGKLSEVIVNSFSLLLHISIPIFTIIFLWGKNLFSFFLGSRWEASGIYAGLLAPWCCFKMCFSPLSIIFSVLERQEFLALLTTAIITTRVLSIMIGGFYNDIYLAILLFGISGVLCNLVGLIMIFYLSKSKPLDIIKALIRNQFHK